MLRTLLVAALASSMLACDEPAVSPQDAAVSELAPRLDQQAPDGRADGRADVARPPNPDWRRPREAGALAPIRCGIAPPAGATLAPPLPSYAGTCPKLVAGTNTLVSSATPRKFILVLPSGPKPGEQFPVLFMWHWLKGSASSFVSQGEVQAAADQQRFIGVVPESKGDIMLFNVVPLPWPVSTYDSQQRLDEELAFFDDMLACVGAQYPVDKECVSSAGVSAGALFVGQLAVSRADRLASFISLSGGVGSQAGLVNTAIRRWSPPGRRLPGLVLWGGPTDKCALLDFQIASQELEAQLVTGQHFFVECVHNCGHAHPPVSPTAGESKYASLWHFFLRHPFWLPAGDSPYLEIGIPGNLTWCGIGKGSATPRTGSCPPPACPI